MSDDELIPRIVESLGLLLDEREQREKFQAELDVRFNNVSAELGKIRQDTKATLDSINQGGVAVFNSVAQKANQLEAIATDMQRTVKSLSLSSVRIGQYIKVRTVGIALAVSFLLGLAAAFTVMNWPRGTAREPIDEISKKEREFGHRFLERLMDLPEIEQQRLVDFMNGKAIPMFRDVGASQPSAPPPIEFPPTKDPQPKG